MVNVCVTLVYQNSMKRLIDETKSALHIWIGIALVYAVQRNLPSTFVISLGNGLLRLVEIVIAESITRD